MISVSPATDAERNTALALLLGLPTTDAHRDLDDLLRAAGFGDLGSHELLVVRRQDGPVGALLMVAQGDGSTCIWPPVVPSGEPEIADALLQDATARLDAAGIAMAQSIIEQRDRCEHDMFCRNGFPYLTDLLFLERSLSRAPGTPATRLDYVTYNPQTHDRFVKILEATYVETMDCPELNGLRDAEQVLAAHKTVGVFLPGLWRLYQDRGETIGILLFAEHPEHESWELVYMGLTPEARGHGHGRTMLQSGLAQAYDAGARKMQLAVDRRNRYARTIYGDFGFVLQATRALHVRVRKNND